MILNPSEWSGPVGARMVIPTPDPPSPDGQPVHPSVVYVDNGWCGWRYWMAYTPYPGGDDQHEDPCVVVSQDGNTWTVPAGLTNPLDNAPGSPVYNSDPFLLVDGVMRLIWRRFDDTALGAEESLWMRTSADGITWTPKVKIYESDKTVRRLVSPSLVQVDGVWHMFAVDLVPAPTHVVHLTAESITGPWSTPTVATLCMRAGKMAWHMHVQRVGSQFVALVADTLQGGTGAREGDLLLATSDDGTVWTVGAVPVVPRVGEYHTDLYQASFVVDERGIDVWYSARVTASPSVWSILRTRLTVDDPRLPYSTASGTVGFGVVPAGGSAAADVVFPPGRFTRAPVVTVSSANGRINPGTAGLSRDSVTVKAFNWTGADATNPILHWVAVQQDR